MKWLLGSRFAQFEQTPWQRFTAPFRHLKWKATRTIQGWRTRYKYRGQIEKMYPFHDLHSQPGRWVTDGKLPTGRKWEGQRTWRTRIGPAIVAWECGSPRYDAWNIRMPDGSRQDVRVSQPSWRRRAKPPLVWVYGELVFHDDDVEFVDLETQPRYEPPPLGDVPNLEAELARLQSFADDLQDDAFALTAFFHLAKLEWMKIGHREYEAFRGDGHVAHMIAGLRGKGENYLDVENERLSAREQRPKNVLSADHVNRLHRHLANIGWRTHTAEEIQAAMREELLRRFRARVSVLRKVKLFEKRAANSHPALMMRRPRANEIPFTLYEGDQKSWLGELTPEHIEAMSGQLTVRIIDLAMTGRVTGEEFDDLKRDVEFGYLLVPDPDQTDPNGGIAPEAGHDDGDKLV